MAARKGIVIGLVVAGLVGMLGIGTLGFLWFISQAGGAAAPLSAFTWRRHRDPMGFSVELPRAWTVRSDPASGKVEMAGTEGERLVVWPLFMAADPGRNAGAMLSRIAQQWWPEARWGAPAVVAGNAWRMNGGTGEAQGTAVLVSVPTPKGTAAFAYLMRAGAREAPFARILESFHLEGKPGGAPGPPPVRYERWRDPREGAFSAEFPVGWQVSGGTTRPSTLLVQSEVQALSPDGISLLLGDAFPIYVEPSPLLQFGGIGPGGTYVDATGYAHPVASYTPGIAFALRAILPQRVGAFRILHQAARPELARQLTTLGINRFDAGEAEYQFQRNGREYRGWALCITERVAAPQVTNWHVWRICLAEAPAARFDDAGEALQHAVSSFRIDPAWAQGQARLTAAQARIITEMGEATSRTILETGRFRAQTMDEIDRRGSNARLGIEEVADPQTGRKMTVSSGSSYYWVDDHGTVLGTDTSTTPNLDFRALTREAKDQE